MVFIVEKIDCGKCAKSVECVCKICGENFCEKCKR